LDECRPEVKHEKRDRDQRAGPRDGPHTLGWKEPLGLKGRPNGDGDYGENCGDQYPGGQYADGFAPQRVEFVSRHGNSRGSDALILGPVGSRG
jgi:hypothetical protein